MKLEILKQHAGKIPNCYENYLGITDELISATSKIKKGQAILNIAPDFGSITAFLAYGLIENKIDNEIHCVDKWEVNKEFIPKTGEIIETKKEKNIFPVFLENINTFDSAGARIFAHKSDFKNFIYEKKRKTNIGLIVANYKFCEKSINHFVETIIPFCIPNETIIYFMDFYSSKESEENSKIQEFIKLNSDIFKQIYKNKKARTCGFQYLGGCIKTLEDKGKQANG